MHRITSHRFTLFLQSSTLYNIYVTLLTFCYLILSRSYFNTEFWILRLWIQLYTIHLIYNTLTKYAIIRKKRGLSRFLNKRLIFVLFLFINTNLNHVACNKSISTKWLCLSIVKYVFFDLRRIKVLQVASKQPYDGRTPLSCIHVIEK